MIYQKTIKKELIVKGIRQSDGKETFVKFLPSESGLWVKYKDQIEPISPYIMNRDEKRFTNSIVIANYVITMVEHIFSAINGLGIDNVIVEFDSSEAPFSADSEYFAKTLSENILDMEHKPKESYRIDKTFEIKGKNGQYCKITPDDDFIIDVTVDFEGIIGRQTFCYSFKQNNYLNDIAYARSILIFEIKDINNPWSDYKKHFDLFPFTLPKNPKESPYIAYTDKEFVTPLKDPLEPVKHKLLDFIGDLIFLGKIPLGKFEIYKPGHSFNRKIVETLFNSGNSYDLQFEYFLKKVPEIKLLEGFVENNIVHKNEDVLTHTKNVFKNVIYILEKYNIEFDNEKRLGLLLATFLHDYGKKDTLIIKEDGTTSCNNHESRSIESIIEEAFLERFNISVKNKEWVLNFIKNHAEIHNVFVKEDIVTRNNLKKFKKIYSKEYIENLVFGISDLKGTYFEHFNNDEYKRRIGFLENELKGILNN